MIFLACQLQEKCIEQNMDFYAIDGDDDDEEEDQ